MTTVFWDRNGRMMAEFMQQCSERLEAYCKTLKKKIVGGHSDQKAWNADIQCSAPP
jgi:hypothetical protein